VREQILIITKKQFYKLLSPYTRGFLDAQQWNDAFAVIPEALGRELKNNNTVHTDIGTFETREVRRKVGGFGKGETPVYEMREEVKYTPSKKLKGMLNDRDK
jgi:nucleoid DNA-binding protein